MEDFEQSVIDLEELSIWIGSHVDLGITRVKDETKKSGFSIKGDVDFDAVSPKCSFISPVPGGVGMMTIAALLKNTLNAYRQQNKA